MTIPNILKLRPQLVTTHHELPAGQFPSLQISDFVYSDQESVMFFSFRKNDLGLASKLNLSYYYDHKITASVVLHGFICYTNLL